jgi:hypothetical protein
MRLVGHVACVGENRTAYRVMVGKPEGKRRRGRHKYTWEDNIEVDLKEIELGGLDWIDQT